LKTFTHINATSLTDVEDQLDEYGSEAWLIAGGTDLIPFLEARCLPREQLPKYIINLKTIPDLDYITEDANGLKLGAMTTLDNIAFSSVVLSKWPALAKAARLVAKWQVRTVATIGGNICCKKRCWYYRAVWNKFDCVLKGGTGCPAVPGNHRYESIFGEIGGCYSVNPNDTPPVLVALDAEIVTNKQSFNAADFFDGFKVHNMGAGEFVKEIVVPAPPSGSKQAFEKATERRAVDFASVNVACLVANGTTRIVMGAVDTVPKLVETTETSAEAVAEAAVANANPISSVNAYKVPMVKGLIKRALAS
jgi:xanthine dehydrogenase YagS FAD-binding subunit